jgi:hypothetical protein
MHDCKKQITHCKMEIKGFELVLTKTYVEYTIMHDKCIIFVELLWRYIVSRHDGGDDYAYE